MCLLIPGFTGVGGEAQGQVKGLLRAQEATGAAPPQGHEACGGAAQLFARNLGTHYLHFVGSGEKELFWNMSFSMVIQSYGSNFDGNEDESFPSVVCISWVIALALVSFYVMVYLNIVTAGTGTSTEDSMKFCNN